MMKRGITFPFLLLYVFCYCVCCSLVTLVGAAENDSTVIYHRDVFQSPFYNDTETFISTRGVAVASAILSGLMGNPMTAAYVTRSISLLGVCKPHQTGPLPLSQWSVSIAIGKDYSTAYYVGAALLNPAVLIGISLCSLAGVGLYAVAKVQTRQQAFATTRFPGFLTTVFYWTMYSSVVASMTVLVSSSDTAMRGLCGIVPPLWIIAFLCITALLYKFLPSRAVFVTNYRERDRMLRKIEYRNSFLGALLEKEEESEDDQRKAEEMRKVLTSYAEGPAPPKQGPDGNLAQPLLAEEQQKEKGEDEWGLVEKEEVPSIPLSTRIQQLKDSSTNTMKRILTNLIKKKEKVANMAKTALGEDFDELLVKDELEGVEKAIAFEYQRLMEATLNDSVLDETESVLAHFLLGEDRWESIDRFPGFVKRYGMLFKSFRQGFTFFFVVEFALSFACAFCEGWRPINEEANSCYGPAIALLVSFTIYVLLIVILRPQVSNLDIGIAFFTGLLQVLAATFAVVTSTTTDQWGVQGTYLCAIGTIYLGASRSLVDVYIVVMNMTAKRKNPWTSIDELSNAYDRHIHEIMIKKVEEVRKRGLSTLSCSGTVNASDGKDAFGENMVSVPMSEEGTAGIHLEFRSVDIDRRDKEFFKRIGGRHCAYVSSRNVPDTLHPFVLKPIKPPLPLPERTSALLAATVEEELTAASRRSRGNVMAKAPRPSMLQSRRKAIEQQMREEAQLSKTKMQERSLERLLSSINEADEKNGLNALLLGDRNLSTEATPAHTSSEFLQRKNIEKAFLLSKARSSPPKTMSPTATPPPPPLITSSAGTESGRGTTGTQSGHTAVGAKIPPFATPADRSSAGEETLILEQVPSKPEASSLASGAPPNTMLNPVAALMIPSVETLNPYHSDLQFLKKQREARRAQAQPQATNYSSSSQQNSTLPNLSGFSNILGAQSPSTTSTTTDNGLNMDASAMLTSWISARDRGRRTALEDRAWRAEREGWGATDEEVRQKMNEEAARSQDEIHSRYKVNADKSRSGFGGEKKGTVSELRAAKR